MPETYAMNLPADMVIWDRRGRFVKEVDRDGNVVLTDDLAQAARFAAISCPHVRADRADPLYFDYRADARPDHFEVGPHGRLWPNNRKG